jgi:hypothetical protein
LLTIAVLAAGTARIALADHDGGKNAETRLRARLAGAAIQGKFPKATPVFVWMQKAERDSM